jgi:hypothetical protein
MIVDLETRIRRANPVARRDQVDRLFGDDVAVRLLHHVERRARITDTRREQPRIEPPASRRRLGWLIAAAAAAGTVLLAGALIVISTGREIRSAAPPAGTEAVTVARSAYDALNQGDVEGWLAHFSADAEVFDMTREAAATRYEILAAARYQAEVIEPCRLSAASVVECTVIATDAFSGAGGISSTRRERFVMNEDGRIGLAEATVVDIVQPGPYTFAQEFWDWLREAHPRVFDQIRPTIRTHLPETPEHMETALEFVDEFLAQSEVYPIVGGS